VKPEDVAEIVESHIINKIPVTRLMVDDNCINTPSCIHKQSRE
jgi:(2Fe-2S) ferredoxin